MPKQTFHNLEKHKQTRIIEAAINEFSDLGFTAAKISTIIKEADISRGSFYQYFEDKQDLYIYLIEVLRNRKIKILQEPLSLSGEIPFVELFHKLYEAGVQFALKEPKLVKIGQHLIQDKGPIFDIVMKDGMKIAKEMYINLIEVDKQKGFIRKDVNSEILAELVMKMTINVTLDDLTLDNPDYDAILNKIDAIIELFKKGIE